MENTLINKKTKFTQVEDCVIRNPMISRNARLLYVHILSYDFGQGSCFPGQERLAVEMGFADERSIRDLLNELRGAGLISWKQNGFNLPNTYSIEEIPKRIKEQYEEIQTKLTHRIRSKEEENKDEKKIRKENIRKAIKEEKIVNVYAGRLKGNITVVKT